MARYWVGGATGFLGSHLVRALIDGGHDVVAVSRGGGEIHGVSVQKVDILDPERVAASARGVDGAFLVAGKVSRSPEDAEELHRANVLGTRAALAGLRSAGVRRVVHASTSGTIAVSTEAHVADESSPAPLELLARWPYYRSKYHAELEALEANTPAAFEVVVVNPSLLLGPGDLRASSTGDVRRFLDGEILATPRGGIALVDVRDAARGMALAMERGAPGERYLLSAANLSIAAFFGRLERITGVPAPAVRLPRSPALAVGVTELFGRAVKAIGGELPMDSISVELGQHYWYCDAAKAIRDLGFSPRDVTDTLRDTVEDLVLRGVAHPRHGGLGRGDGLAPHGLTPPPLP
jgi:dihydroflavonol-4-reductase